MSRAPADPPSGARVWPLDGPRATMMDSLVSALVVVRSAIPRAMALPADIDIVAAEGPVGESVIAAARSLAESLLEEMVERDAQRGRMRRRCSRTRHGERPRPCRWRSASKR